MHKCIQVLRDDENDTLKLPQEKVVKMANTFSKQVVFVMALALFDLLASDFV
jgi:hypothetical protein